MGFLERALAWYTGLGITVERVMPITARPNAARVRRVILMGTWLALRPRFCSVSHRAG